MNNNKKNNDPKTVSSFGDEWARFDQKKLIGDEHAYLFDTYFHIFSLGISSRQCSRI